MSIRHVHLLDPQLHGVGGHYLNHDTQLVTDLQRRGVPVTLYGRQGAAVTVAGLTPVPVFTRDIFVEQAGDAQVWAIENFHNVNQAFLADLCRIPAERFSAEDLVYFPNLLQNQLYAVALWLLRFPVERRPAVAVMLRYLNHAMDYVAQRANKDLIALYYRYAARMLSTAQPRALLCADTRELAQAYQRITELPVLELPNPMDVSALLARTPADAPADAAAGTENLPASAASSPAVTCRGPAPKNARPVVVYQGHTSPLRGFHFLPEIMLRGLQLSPRPRFVVQVQNREVLQGQLAPVAEMLTKFSPDDVTLVEGALSSDDYLALLASADVVLLPYTPTFYGHGSSGVFTEAASVGKVVVVSPNTVPARQGAEFNLGVVTATEWTPVAMAEAVALALRNLPTLRARAAAGAARYRAENCARTLWDRLLAAVPPPVAGAIPASVPPQRAQAVA